MRRLAALAIVALGWAIHADPEGLPQQSVFRASTDMVLVNVSVRDGTRAVPGLTNGDFEILDNGAPQRVEGADPASGPLDLTLVVDMGFLADLAVANFRGDVRKIASLLGPTDRLRVITSATDIEEVQAMLPPTDVDVTSTTEGGGSSIDDAVLSALTWPAAEGRRDVVVAFSNAFDTTSVLPDETLPYVAERSDAILELVLTPLFLPNRQPIPDYPRPTATRRALSDAATRTGGDVIYLADAVGGVRHALEDARESYTLRYTLRGIARAGWHDVTVKVTRPGAAKYTVRARKGYFATSSSPTNGG
jgi:hypothetical protein